jgi:L-lactate dehydrogenase (cytochrome)
MMNWHYDRRYPSVESLREKAMKRIPPFAFDYLDGGCNEDVNLFRNTDQLREVELKPVYLREHGEISLRTELFGHTYDAPFGIAPIGLQGLIWPDAPRILAKAAFAHNIPFVLSTVTTASIEEIAGLTEGRAWYQLYHPAESKMRDALIDRAADSGYQVLVLLCDVPSFGYRPRDIRNGLSMPPQMTMRNILQIMTRPEWAVRTLLHGQPEFSNMKPYMPKGLNMKQLGSFMNKTFSGRLNEERIKPIRDKWKGKLVLKGVASVEDAEMAVKLGLDGIIVSNHGGRQLDAGQSTIRAMSPIVRELGGKIRIMMDSGIRSGPDIGRAIASGADFSFLGRTFMYSVAALGRSGGDHAIAILKTQLKQLMEQLSCSDVRDLPERMV